MKGYLLIISLFSLLFTSCEDILFVKPQPSWIVKNETSFPEKVRGIYVNQRADTISISANKISPRHPKKDDTIFTLSDSLILRVDKDNYYLNMRSEQYWDVNLGKIKGDTLFTYTLDAKDEKVRNAVASITPFVSLKEDSGKYVINPSGEEFRKILDKNLFNQGDVYLKVSNRR